MDIKKSTDFSLIEKFLSNNFSVPTHWPEWNQVISKYYNTDFYYLTAWRSNELIGICPLHDDRHKVRNNLYSGQFLNIPYGGWIFKEKTTIDKSFFKLKFNQLVQVFSLPLANDTIGLPSFNKTKSFATLLIDLKKDEDWLWENCVDSKRRNMIRKALKNELTVDVVSKENYLFFYEFYKEANTRYGLPIHSPDCLSDLFFSTTKNRFHASFVKHEGVILSSHVMAYDKDYSLYWLGLNAAKAPNMGQGELLQWEAIRYAKKAGCSIYDLCYIEKERLPAIYEFKKGFAKKEVSINYFEIKPLSYKILNKLLKQIKHRA
jgi:hypothetical protein